MFSGFPSLTTPSIQVWDYTGSQASTSATRSITLTDDCAPIQYFRTGNSLTTISVYLPISPPEGKIIKVINHRYGGANQQVAVYYPDTSVGTAVQYFALGVGQTVDFCFSKMAYGFGPSNGYQKTGWMMLTQAGSSSMAYYGVSFSDGSHASGVQSMALGGTSSTASGQAAIVAGGFNNTASQQYSAIVGGSSSTASGSSAAVIGGSGNTASGSSSASIGGSSNNSSGTSSGIFAGSNNANSSTYGGVLAGYANQASGSHNAIVGGASGSNRNLVGYTVFPASNTPVGVNTGASQVALLVIGTQTTDATVTTLRSNTSAAGTTNQLVLASNSAYHVRGSCIANVTSGGNTKAWSFEAVIKRSVIASSTAIVGAVIKNVVAADAGASTWDITVSADTTNGALAVSVTGQAATTIRWVCRLDSTEVTY